MSSKRNKEPLPPPSTWENKFGKTTDERVQWLGKDSAVYRKDLHFPPPNEEKMEIHGFFMQKLGADILATMHVDEEKYQRERQRLKQRQRATAEVLRRKVRIEDLDDGGVSIAIDQDWETSTWNDAQVEAACEALLLIFYELGASSMERKERAVLMLQKLTQRHSAAEKFLRNNIEKIVSKATSKMIRNGTTFSVLNLLIVLNACKDRFAAELSGLSFNTRAIEMLIQEARIAAALIQHTVRSRKAKRRLRELKFPHTGFGSDREVFYRQLGVINTRSAELRKAWRAMHRHHPREPRDLVGGVRGPIHISGTFLGLTLDVVRFLVSDRTGKLAQSNREDFVRAQGCILLSTYLGCAGGPFSFSAAVVLSEVAKICESFLHILLSGALASAIKFMRYLRTLYGVGTAVLPSKKNEKIPIVTAYLAAVEILSQTALHAAGFYRATEEFGYVRSPRNGIEIVDYQTALRGLPSPERAWAPLLGSRDTLIELSIVIQRTQQPTVLAKALFALLCLLSSACHKQTMLEVTATAGLLMLRLLALLQSEDLRTSSLALCVLLQLCAEQSDRQALRTVSIHSKLLEMNRNAWQSKELQNSLSARRSLLVSVALCRQGDWKYYDPEVLLHTVLPSFSVQSPSVPSAVTADKDATAGSGEWLREALLLNILQTITGCDYDGVGLGGTRALRSREHSVVHPFTIADLVLWPALTDREQAMSREISLLSAREVCDFLVHPEDDDFYESLPLEEAAAVCQIVDSLCAFDYTARLISSPALLRFLAKFLYLCKYLFLGKPMLDRQVQMVLCGVRSAQSAIARLCRALCLSLASGDNESDSETTQAAWALLAMSKATSLPTTSLFFLNTLSEFNHLLENDTRERQKEVGLSALQMYTQLAALLAALSSSEKTYGSGKQRSVSAKKETADRTTIEDLYEAAKLTSKILLNLRSLYTAKNNTNIAEFCVIHEQLCSFLVEMTRSPESSYTALKDWSIQAPLRFYLPAPLSGVDLVPFSALGLAFSPVGEVYVHQRHQESFEEFSASLESFTKKETPREPVRGFAYRLELMELSAAFFELCVNLCAHVEGVAFCFMEGFVRRALDKLTIVRYQLTRVRDPATGSISPQYPWAERKRDLTTCLRLITRTANHTQPRHGAANDLILNELFDVVGGCKDVMALNIRRDDKVVVAAYKVLAALARDSFRIQPLLAKHDIFAVIVEEVRRLRDLPRRGALAMLEIIHFSCLGLTSQYIVESIPRLREPLTKIARMFSSLDDEVRRANWTLTKSAMIYRQSVDPSFLVQGEIDLEIEEFVRTGSLKKTQTISVSPSQKEESYRKTNDDSNQDMFSPQKKNTSAALSAIQSEMISDKPASLHQDSALAKTPSLPGSYSRCGIASCGSLRFPDLPHDHETFRTLSPDQTLALTLKLPAVDKTRQVLPVSQLSARERGLRDLVEYRKGKEGMAEVVKKSVFTSPSGGKKTKPNHTQCNLTSSSNGVQKRLFQETAKATIQSVSLSELPDLILTRPPKK